VLATVKGKLLRNGLRPPLTFAARSGQPKSGRDKEMIDGWSNKEMDEHQLDRNRPIQVLVIVLGLADNDYARKAAFTRCVRSSGGSR